jgi:hypothetical protein
MSQSNYNIPNQSAPAVRAQLNAVFGSIATNNSGSTAPSTTFAYQWWYDTSTDTLKQRNAANSAWINIGTFDQSGGTFTPAGQRDLASQVEAEAGTDNTKLMTPLRTAQSSNARNLAWGQTLQSPTRVISTSYQNTTGKPITVMITGIGIGAIQISQDSITWFQVGNFNGSFGLAVHLVVPDQYYYRMTGATIQAWVEMR